MRLAAALAFVLTAACGASVLRLLPPRLWVGSDGAEVDRAVAAARLLHERGRGREALTELQPLLAAHPECVDGQRLRQDILRARGRTALLRHEAELRVAAAPDDAIAHYLRGRVLPAAAQPAVFQRAVELAPTSLWPWLGYAFSLRGDQAEHAIDIYARLYEQSDRHPLVGVAYAHTLRSNGRLRPALAVYEQLAAGGSAPGIGELGSAQTLLALGNASERPRAWSSLLAALRLRPFDPGVHALIRELLRLGLADEQVEQLVDTLRADPAAWRDFAAGDGVDVMLALLRRAQQPHAALAVLAAAGTSARMPAWRREQRRLLLATGDVGAFLELLATDLPSSLLADESNQVRSRWLGLLDGPWSGPGSLRDGAMAVGLARSLADCGLLIEAELLAEMALVRWPDTQGLAAVRDEVRRELAFENALRRLLYRGYADSRPQTLEQLLTQVREVSKVLLGNDVVGEVAEFSVPLVGSMLDPFTAGLCLHLQRYNRHLAIGARAGGVTEGLMLTRLSVRDLPPDAAQPLPGRCREVIGMDRDVRSLTGVLGGDLAGIALLNHYVIDYDAVLEWAQGIANHQRIAREDGGELVHDPVPAGTAADDALDVNWRLCALSSLQDKDLDLAVLDIIRTHERRHLVDSFHYLPFEQNLWRGLGLLLQFGLSAQAVEAEMERRAELAALACSPHQRLVLAHIAEFHGESDLESPHVRGFTALGRQLTAELVAGGVPEATAAVANWHLLDPAAVSRAARALLLKLP